MGTSLSLTSLMFLLDDWDVDITASAPATILDHEVTIEGKHE